MRRGRENRQEEGFLIFLNVENDQESRDTNKTLTSSASSDIKKKCLKPAGAVSQVHHRHPVSSQPTQPFSPNHRHVSECDSWKSPFIAYYSPTTVKLIPGWVGASVLCLWLVFYSTFSCFDLNHCCMSTWWTDDDNCIDHCDFGRPSFQSAHDCVLLIDVVWMQRCFLIVRELLEELLSFVSSVDCSYFHREVSTVTRGPLFLMERSWWWWSQRNDKKWATSHVV